MTKTTQNMLNNDQYKLLFAMILACICALLMRPSLNESTEQLTPLDEIVPLAFGDWQAVASNAMAVDLYKKTEGERSTDNPYDDTVMRTYQNRQGEQIQLAIAYGKSQRQEVKIHRPELCYYAQGFDVKQLNNKQFSVASGQLKMINGKNMLVTNGQEWQAVSYWIRIGNIYSQNAWKTRFYILKEGLLGHVPDGVLVRASSDINTEDNALQQFDKNAQFLKELVRSLGDKTKSKMIIK